MDDPMSLKAFHIVFIVVCAMLCVGLGAWSFLEYKKTPTNEFVGGMIVSLAALVALSIYGRWFLRKLRNESYL